MGFALPLAIFDLAKGGYEAIDANQQAQKQKGYLGAAYRSGMARLAQAQGYQTEDTAEGLNARGLGVGSNVPVRSAMNAGGSAPMQVSGAAPTTIGGQVTTNLANEQAVDRNNVTQQYTQALHDNTALARNTEINAIGSGIAGAANAYGQGQIANAMGGTPAGGLPAGVTQSGTTYSGDPMHAALASASWHGVNPVDPFHASSSWKMPGFSSGPATADFHV